MLTEIAKDRIYSVVIHGHSESYEIAAFERIHDAADFIEMLGVSCSLEQGPRSMVSCKITPVQCPGYLK
jgi:hypothetical protein